MVLHTSWRGRLTATVSPILALVLGFWAYTGRGFDTFSTALLVLGIGLAAAVLWDYPLHTTFGMDGIHRRCALRVQTLGWERLEALVRPKKSPLGIARPGLSAEIRKRPYFLLCDRVESQAEYDAITSGMRVWGPNVPIRASRPMDGVAPTWLYKRKPAEIGPERVDRQA